MDEIEVLSFPDNCEVLFKVETGRNPLGLCEIATVHNGDKQLMVFPAKQKGAVQLVVCKISGICFNILNFIIKSL